MDSTLLVLAAFACPVGMGLMMWMMMRNNGGMSRESKASKGNQADQEIAELRTEIERLKAERLQKRSTAGEP